MGNMRTLDGLLAKIIIGVAFAWSLFQLWYASPLPYYFNFGVLNDTQARSIHLAFAVFLAFTFFPALKTSPQGFIPLKDWFLALLAAFSAAYIFLFYEELSNRSGAPTTYDLIIATTGLLLLLEATRRTLGLPLMIVAMVFLTYVFAGPYMPEVIAHKGASVSKVMSHQWLGTEGVFGVALGVSTSFVFLFVLFGAFLEKAGAGSYFIKVSFALVGHMRGGPAKAAVVASGLTGMISGSSIANVVTTGTFTIPLMKKMGFSGTKAGAIEVAASTNGQLTPPVMGAAAFLMVEYVGISYMEVIKHAILPALISYIALIYIVHLEALKANMQGLPRRAGHSISETLLAYLTLIIGIILLSFSIYYGIGWLKLLLGNQAIWIIAIIMLLSYIGLVWYASYYDLDNDIVLEEITKLPELGPTIKSGLYFLLPVVVLMWCLIVERLSPGLSAFWATLFMIFIVITHKPLIAFFRKERNITPEIKRGFYDFLDGMTIGAKNMVGIGVATATAGIIVGTVTLTGLGLVMTEFVEFMSGGNLMIMLIFTAVICLILGMGLPTTANYIVVSTLMAPVIVSLGATNGLVVPLIAVHMFVFYFGILADDTPPVGLAAFAASAIANSDPIKTGIQGFTYDIRTAILPFLFIFNTQLLLIDIDNWFELLLVIFSAVSAMLLFAAATQGYWFIKSKLWESLALLLIAFTLFRPGFWWDYIYPPLKQENPIILDQIAQNLPVNHELRIVVTGETIDGKNVQKTVLLPLGGSGTGVERLLHAGIETRIANEKVYIDNVVFDSPAKKMELDFNWEIIRIELENARPTKQWMFIPAILLLIFIGYIQLNRRKSHKY
jgi:TRAP transporter 4TM/12TM fusion protein